jgi:hypothetical protein
VRADLGSFVAGLTDGGTGTSHSILPRVIYLVNSYLLGTSFEWPGVVLGLIWRVGQGCLPRAKRDLRREFIVADPAEVGLPLGS